MGKRLDKLFGGLLIVLGILFLLVKINATPQEYEFLFNTTKVILGLIFIIGGIYVMDYDIVKVKEEKI